jgi:5-methyltetrahydrofolate--homocysteine methyltransferase
MLERIVAEKWLTARGVAGFWPCAREGDDVVIYLTEEERHVRLPFLRQQIRKSRDRANFCLADFIDPGRRLDRRLCRGHPRDRAAPRTLPRRARRLFNDILLKALADRFAEAFAERLHQHVRTTCGAMPRASS